MLRQTKVSIDTFELKRILIQNEACTSFLKELNKDYEFAFYRTYRTVETTEKPQFDFIVFDHVTEEIIYPRKSEDLDDRVSKLFNFIRMDKEFFFDFLLKAEIGRIVDEDLSDMDF